MPLTVKEKYFAELRKRFQDGKLEGFNEFFKQAYDKYPLDFDELIRRVTGMSEEDQNTTPAYFVTFADKDYYPLPSQGWKIHISAKPESALAVANVCFPFLERYKVVYKTVNSIAKMKAMRNDTTQKGKFITVYPKNEKHAVQLAEKIELLIRTSGLKPADFDKVPEDAPYGNTGGIFVRYGGFTTFILEAVNLDGTPILNADGTKRLLEDDRNLVRPDFVTWNPFGAKVKI